MLYADTHLPEAARLYPADATAHSQVMELEERFDSVLGDDPETPPRGAGPAQLSFRGGRWLRWSLRFQEARALGRSTTRS